MPGNKLLPFLKDISQMTAIFPFFPLPINTEWHALGSYLEEWTHTVLFCLQPSNFCRKPWSGLAYGYQSDSKAKTFKNIKAAICQNFPSRSSKVCTAHHWTDTGHRFQPCHKPSAEVQGAGDSRSPKTTIKGSLTFNFHYLCVRPLRGAAAAAVWAGGEGDALQRGYTQAAASLAGRLRKRHWHQLQKLSLPAPPQVQVPGKTAGSQRSTDEIGPGWKEQGGPRSGERRWQLKKWDGTGAKPCAAAVPQDPLQGQLLQQQVPTEGGYGKPVGVRSGDVYYPAIYSLPKITAIDTRSTGDVSVIDTYWI